MSVELAHVNEFTKCLVKNMQTEAPYLIALKSGKCGACLRLDEQGFFHQLSKRCEQRNIGLVVLSTDSYEYDDVRSFMKQHGLTYLPSFIRLEKWDDKKGTLYDLRNENGPLQVENLIIFFENSTAAV
ncbi:hypothetical protein CYMTET_41410 [Cymbomonas tetramitiformis]|uniref:Thioredoxin domain-containing protein n=1 Tax=Cymbomonas tetramitiformis TaxID=36881 RepID=A0AAE0C8B0_9CHLO|nr:hypothetical protein CYMTET_41410 [Cymbomonas tetramitiformis]|eukprot:gene19689-23551_t